MPNMFQGTTGSSTSTVGRNRLGRGAITRRARPARCAGANNHFLSEPARSNALSTPMLIDDDNNHVEDATEVESMHGWVGAVGGRID